MAQVDYKAAAQEVLKYIENDLPEVFSKETIADSNIKNSFNKIKNEAKNLLAQFNALEVMREKGNLLYRKQLYLVNVKAYSFIEKTREFFTKETIEYLLVTGKEKPLQLKQATLEEILPMLRIGRERDKAGGGTKIQIRNLKSEINKLKDANFKDEQIKENIENFYYILTKQIRFYNEKTKIMSGYAIEAAAVAATKKASFEILNREMDVTDYIQLKEDLMDIYQKQIKGQKTPFFGGGDLSNEIAKELLRIAKNIQLQVKNLSSGGASVATTAALINVLKYLVLVLSKPLNVSEIKKTLTEQLFKTNKQITDILSNTLKDTLNLEILEKELASLPNVTLK